MGSRLNYGCPFYGGITRCDGHNMVLTAKTGPAFGPRRFKMGMRLMASMTMPDFSGRSLYMQQMLLEKKVMNSSKIIRKTRLQKIEQLIEIVNEGNGEKASGERLTHTERRFFLKHPDWVAEVFQGIRSHVRANEIIRKMKAYNLDTEDVEAVHSLLKQRSSSNSPPG